MALPDRESIPENEEETFEIYVKIGRAALGEARLVFVEMLKTQGKAGIPAYVPKENITIYEQRLTGETLIANLSVRIVEDHGDYLIVETETEGREMLRFRVNKQARKLEPVRNEPVYVLTKSL